MEIDCMSIHPTSLALIKPRAGRKHKFYTTYGMFRWARRVITLYNAARRHGFVPGRRGLAGYPSQPETVQKMTIKYYIPMESPRHAKHLEERRNRGVLLVVQSERRDSETPHRRNVRRSATLRARSANPSAAL